MEELQLALAYGLPMLMALGAALALVLIAGLAWSYPMLPGLAFLAVIFTFSSSRYGVVGDSGSTIYSRGTGQLFFPALLWLLLLGAVWMGLARSMGQAVRGRALASQPAASLQRWFLLWFLLLLGHIGVGLALDVPLAEILDGNGFIYVPVAGLLVSLMLAGARDARSVATLLLFIELAALAKACFGLVRWAGFGGDPANVYANVEKLAVKLTFFELNDSLICLLGMAVAVSQLFLQRAPGERPWRRALHWAVLLLGLACVVLSFRRTAWVGLLLSFGWLLWHLRPQQRLAALLLAAPVLLAAIGFVAYRRLGAQADQFGLLSLVYDLMGSRYGSEGARVLELRLAAREFIDSPLWGNGAWGRYAATSQIAWQDGARPGSFLHSGLLHVAMKTGLIGLVLTAGLIQAFLRRSWSLKGLDSASQALLAAGSMGLLFMVPDFLFGTPIPQYRTMLLIGLCLSLPFFVARARATQAAS